MLNMADSSKTRLTKERQGASDLRVQDLDVVLDARRILDHVTLQAQPGGLVGLLGPNGSGKSTLLRAISSFLQPAFGAVTFDGADLMRLSSQERARIIARIPQNTSLEFNFTVREAVLMGRHPHLARFAMEGEHDGAIARQALQTVGMEEYSDRTVDTLSGGERQLVLVARALAQGPRLLLLDEPTASLDIGHQVQVMDLVTSLTAQSLTAIAALHDLSLAAAYCTHIVLLSGGKIVAQGTPDAVLTPENIQRVFRVAVSLTRDPASNRLLITPSQPPARLARPARVHVISGGGTGAQVISLLRRAGHRVSAGVLNEGDTDLSAARAAGAQVVSAPPFAPVDDRAHALNLTLVREADVVLLTEVPFGQANIRNLEAARHARHLLMLEGPAPAARDFTGGNAAALLESLRAVATPTTREQLLGAIDRTLSTAPASSSHAADQADDKALQNGTQLAWPPLLDREGGRGDGK
jgi:iron complex transport system ATP-binding protein